MLTKITTRMKDWIEGLGCHLCTSSLAGVPTVVIARYAKVTEEDEIAFALAKDEYAFIKPDLDEDPWISVSVSHQGSVMAPYQFKGIGTVYTEGSRFDKIAKDAKKQGVETIAVIYVKLREIYCTRPGPEAGMRLDVMPFEDVVKEDKKWHPPKPPARPK